VEEVFSLLQPNFKQNSGFLPTYSNRVDFYFAQGIISAARNTLSMMEGLRFYPQPPEGEGENVTRLTSEEQPERYL
jgi:hypothetical protein